MNTAKKFFNLLIAVAVLLTVNMSTCDAVAFFDTAEQFLKPGYRVQKAFVEEAFFESDRYISVHIEKQNVIEVDSPRDFYGYVIEIAQLTEQEPFDIKSILIMTETDSVQIDASKATRTTGLDFVTDTINYFYDPGKINCVMSSTAYRMLIKITTTDDKEYNIYPTSQFINYAKLVADWR